MEVAPQELAQLLKLAGVGAGPEPDMPEPEVSVMAIPSDDGAPVGGGCGAPEPEHNHPHDHDDMRSIIDMLQSSGDEPIEEAPPKDDYENASNEFTGHPVDVVDTYDQYSYEPAKNSGMQRRTNSYGDNPLREEDLIKEYTEFKYLLERDPQDILKEKEPAQDFSQQAKLKGQLGDVQARIQSDKDLDAEFDRLGLGKWYDISSMWKSDDEERAEKLQAIQDFYHKQQMGDLKSGRAGAGEDEAMADNLGIPRFEPTTDGTKGAPIPDEVWKKQLAAKQEANAEKIRQDNMNMKARMHAKAWGKGPEGEAEAKLAMADPNSASSQQALATADTAKKDAEARHYDKAVAQYAKTGDASVFQSNSNMSPELQAKLDTTRKDPKALAKLSVSKAPDPNEIAQGKIAADGSITTTNPKAIAGGPLDEPEENVPMTNITPKLRNQIQAQNTPAQSSPRTTR